MHGTELRNSLKKNRIFIVMAAITLIACAVLYRYHSAGRQAGPQTVHVETMVIALHPATEHLQSIGIIQAAHNIVLSSEVTGTVENLAVSSGSTVRAGDILLNLHHADVLAELERDQAILAQAGQFYQRQQQLQHTHAVSEEALSESLSKYRQASATVDADRARLDRYIIRAPFSGQTGIWQIDTGQLVRAGDPLVTLTALSPAFADFMLPSTASSKVSVGNPVTFTTASWPGIIFNGRIIAIDPQLDPATRGLRLRAQLENTGNHLLPALSGTVQVIRQLPPRISVPQEAIMYDPDGASVYVVRNGQAFPQRVVTGAHEESGIL